MDAQRASRTAVVAGFVIGVVAALSLGAVQGQPSSGPIEALLGEVHALRLAMEQQASIGPRMQLTLSRLTIEEQRVTHLNAELDSIRQRLDGTAQALKREAYELASEERALQTETDPAKRSVREGQVERMKNELTVHTAGERQLRERENEALQALASEQSRWMDLNARLDELERLLGPLRP